MIERLVEWSVNRHKILLAVLAFVALVAAFLARDVTLDALPDITNNQVLVLTAAPGFSPDEIERRVTLPIELALAGAPGLIERRSISRFGISSVTAVFDDALPAQIVRQSVAERLNAVRGALPAGVAEPELGPLTGGLGEIFHFSLRSKQRSLLELRELAHLRVGPILRRIPGVVELNSWGGEHRTLQVRADLARLSLHKLTLPKLAASIADGVGVAPGAAVPRGSGRQVLLRALARPVTPSQLSLLRIRSEAGHSVRLSDLGSVTTGALPRLGAATQDGAGEVVYLMAQMLRDENALRVTKRIRSALADVRRALPEDVAVDLVYDRSALVNATLHTVTKNLLEGGALVLVVLFALLGSVRAGLIVAAVIPLAMLGASVGMLVFGIAGNLMSLGALDFGLLVDGAIVMVEHVFHAQQHMPPKLGETRAQWLARHAGYVARPTLFSVLTILLVYLPVLSLRGVDGKMFRPMALVVVMALTSALILSLTYVPAATAAWLRAEDVPARVPLIGRAVQWVNSHLLDLATRHRAWTAACACALLAIGATAYLRSGTELAPALDEGDLVVQTTRGADISLDQAIRDSHTLERAIKTVPEVERVVSRIGSPEVATDIMGLEQADVFVRLAPRDAWRSGRTRDALIADVEHAIRRVDRDVELSFTQPIQMRFNELLGGAVTDVSISVFGQDLGELRRIAELVAHETGAVPGARDVRVLAPPDVPVMNVEPNYAAAAELDVTARDVLSSVEAIRSGLHAAVTYDGPLPVPIIVKASEVNAPGDVARVMVSNQSGGLLSLGTVSNITLSDTPSVVQHLDGQRRLLVGFNVRGADLGSVVSSAQARVAQRVQLPAGYHLEWGGQIATLDAAAQRLLLVVPFVLVMIVALMWLVFHALGPVLLLLSHIPFACVGGATALWLRGMPISISAAVGFIALSGIAVMNGMVLLVQLRQYEDEGQGRADAARHAAIDRARPVVMTAAVAAFGFIPMMLAQGVGAEVQRPLATVVVGGLLTATPTTLVLLPALYGWLPPRKRVAASKA